MGTKCCKVDQVDEESRTQKEKREKRSSQSEGGKTLRKDESLENQSAFEDWKLELERIKVDPFDKLAHLEEKNDLQCLPSGKTKLCTAGIRTNAAKGDGSLSSDSKQRSESYMSFIKYSYSNKQGAGDARAEGKNETVYTTVTRKDLRKRVQRDNHGYWSELARHRNIGHLYMYVNEVYDGLPMHEYPTDSTGYETNVKILKPTWSAFLNEEWVNDCGVQSFSYLRRRGVVLTAKERELCQQSELHEQTSAESGNRSCPVVKGVYFYEYIIYEG